MKTRIFLFGLTAISGALWLSCGCSKGDEAGSKVNVSGVIKDENGNPLAKTAVMISGPDVVEITTDEKGQFSNLKVDDSSESGLKVGSYTVEAQGPSGKLVGNFDVKSGEEKLDIQLQREEDM